MSTGRFPLRMRAPHLLAIVGLAIAVTVAACAPPPPTTTAPTTTTPTTTAPTTTAPTTTAPTTTAPPTTAPPTTVPPTTAPPTTVPPTTAPPAATGQPAGAGAAANRVIFWTKCPDVLALSDSDLDTWRSRGVTGFVCRTYGLYALGGAQDFSANPAGPPAGPQYDLQRQFISTKIVQRAAARGIKLWLGIGMTNYYNPYTAWAEWFDDASWANTVIPNMQRMAAGAKVLGLAGIGFDEELYSTKNGAVGDWNWDYPTNTHSEAQVRAQVKVRGAQLMQAMLAGYPNIDVIDIGWRLPEGWEELVQKEVNGIANANAPRVDIDFWDGMTSISGYGQIRFMDSSFNKTPHLYKATWDTAMTYNTNRLFSLFSKRFSNWSYASSHVQVSTFAWISDGMGSSFESARSPAEVAQQLSAFRRWGTGDAFANYAFSGLTGFNYAPYAPGLQAAAAPGVVDTQAPTIAVTSKGRIADNALVSGSAVDNMGIKAVRWSTASGRSGTAKLTWTVTGGSYGTGYQWRMDWLVGGVISPGELITITAEDVKGLVTTTTVVAL